MTSLSLLADRTVGKNESSMHQQNDELVVCMVRKYKSALKQLEYNAKRCSISMLIENINRAKICVDTMHFLWLAVSIFRLHRVWLPIFDNYCGKQAGFSYPFKGNIPALLIFILIKNKFPINY